MDNPLRKLRSLMPQSNEASPKQRLKVSGRMHDSSQVQLEFQIGFQDLQAGEDSASSDFLDVEYRLVQLFPAQLLVNSSTYPTSRMYRDVRNLYRFREPKLSFKAMLGLVGGAKLSPLSELKNRLTASEESIDASVAEELLIDAKLFGTTFAHYFYRRLRRRKDRLTNGTTKRNFKPLLDFLGKSHALMREWRILISLIESMEGKAADKLSAEMKLIDEYCTYVFVDGLTSLLMAVRNAPEDVDPSVTRKLNAYLRLERWRCRKESYFWLHSGYDELGYERFYYRRRVLKRHVWSVLFLKPREPKSGAWVQNLPAMVAAALAAIWALAANLAIWSYTDFRGFDNINRLLGVNGLLVIAAVVGAYVLKDRIKDIGKQVLRRLVPGSEIDGQIDVVYDPDNGSVFDIANIKSLAQYVTFESLPSAMRKLAKKHRRGLVLDGSRPGKVLEWTRFVRVNGKELRRSEANSDSLQVISRLNFDRFKSRLDDSVQKGWALGDDGEVEAFDLPKVYYIDLVVEMKTSGQEDPVLGMFRVVLTKDGISRVDTLKS